MEQVTMPKAVYDEIMNRLDSLNATVQRLTAIIEEKNQIILNQNRARFGQSSEKRSYVLSDGQTSLFDITGDGITEKAPAGETPAEKKEITVAAHARKPKRTMEEFAANLPEEPVVLDLPEEKKYTSDGRPLKCIGEDLVRTELIREPARAYVRKIYCKAYADPKAEEETGCADIRRPHVPAPLLPHSYASASVVTDIAVKKYVDGSPLYRQEQEWKRLGVDLKRGTMGNWMIQTSEIYLKPFSDAFQKELKSQAVIHADETVLQVNREPGRAAAEESRIWAYASSKRAKRQVRYFRYEPSREGACAEEALKGFHGILVCDGYSGYNVVGNVIRAGCWAHMRRKWHEAMPKGANLENSAAARGFDYCDRLFALEREYKELSDEERLKQRRIQSKPIVDDYYSWLETIFHPAGKLKDAVRYAVKQRPHLCAFLDHGEIEISNNQVENAIRPIVVGRKNWLFCDTPAGARTSVIVFTVLETAKANGINPQTYLNHLLNVLPERFVENPKASINDLMPWSEGIRERFAMQR